MHQSIELALLYRLVYHALWVDSIATELGGEYKSTMFRIFGLFSTLFSPPLGESLWKRQMSVIPCVSNIQSELSRN